MLRSRSLRSLLFLALGAGVAIAGTPAPVQPEPPVSFSIVLTGQSPTREALVFSGGNWSTEVLNNFSAVIVRHGERTFLFDTGLGRDIDRQYREDMPRWRRMFFKYRPPIRPVRDQLTAAGMPTARLPIFLSHSHWDHASALVDFPGSPVLVPEAEMDAIRHPRAVGGAWPSQVGSKAIPWRSIRFRPTPYEGFTESLDWFGDGSVVFVPMPGHTPGSMGMFVTVSSGRRYFFVGDTVWNARALVDGRPKFVLARALVDADADGTAAEIAKIRAAMARDPSLTVVPAHDSAVQDRLGYFPGWVR